MDNQPMPSTPTPPSSTNPSETFLLILGLIVLMAISAVGGYFLGTRKSAPPQNVACTQDALLCPDGSSVGRIPPRCEFATCPTSMSDETANWKTYTSKKYVFKYPFDWEEIKNVESGGPAFRPIDKSSMCNIQVIGPGGIISNVDLEDTYKVAGGNLMSREEVTVDGYKAIKQAYYLTNNNTLHRELIVKNPLIPPSPYTATNTVSDISTTILVWIQSFIVTNDQKDQDCKQIFDQILSTFQFTQ